MITTLSTGPSAPAADHREWWERQQSRRQRREAGRQQRAGGAITSRAVLSWLAVASLLFIGVIDDDVRAGLLAFGRAGALFLIWFVIARTRTVSWRLAVAAFAGAVLWALLVILAAPLSSQVSEVALLLAPLAAVPIAFPGRVRRFSVIDWLLAGAALGTGYQAVEASVRAVADQLGAAPAVAAGPDAGRRYLGFALLGAAIGVGVAIARHGGRLTRSAAMAGRAAGVVLPLGGLAILIGAQLPPEGGLPVVLGVMRAAGSSAPLVVTLLVLLMLAGLLIDTRRIRTTDEPGTDRIPYPYPPAEAADRWTLAITGPGTPGPASRVLHLLTAGVWAACCMPAYIGRDLLMVLGAHVRDPKEPAAQALSRGRAAGSLVRILRAEAFGPLDDHDHRRSVRATGITALVVLSAVGILLARLGDDAPGRWLHAATTALGAGTHDLGLDGIVAGAIGLAATLILITGVPAIPITESGTRRLLLDHGRGTVAFTRSGSLAERLRGSTVAELGLDLLTSLIALIPAPLLQPFAGSATSGPARAIVAEFCADPARLIARRRRQLSAAADDTGAIIAIRTGTWDAASRRRWVDNRMASRAYRITSADGRTSVPADGLSLDADGVAMLEATHLHRRGAPMLYEGEAPAMLANRLLAPFDDEMRRYATVIRDPHNPVTRLRLIVGSQPAAGLLGGRAREILGPDLEMMVVIHPVEE